MSAVLILETASAMGPGLGGVRSNDASREQGRLLATRLGLSVWLLCAFFANGFVGNPMSNAMVDLTVSLVEDQALSINKYVGNVSDVSIRDGKYYSGITGNLIL